MTSQHLEVEQSEESVEPVGSESRPRRSRSPLLLTVTRALRLGRTRVGLALVIIIVGIAVFGPLLAPESTTGFVGPPYQPPGDGAALGTDFLGRDTLSRFLSGGRSVLILSLLATVLGLVAGVGIGLVAAYSRSSMDDVIMRSMDILLAFPQIVFVLLLVSTIGPKLWLLVLTVAATHAPRVARLARGAALEVVERDFVKAAEVLGEPRWRILLGEILPNITSPLMVEASLRLTYSIGLVAAISFLGFGLQPPAADWGLMINENRVGLTVQPWPVALPALAIGLLTIGTNLIADGLSRALIGVDRGATEA
jgi:peptide/nickel transport system permease protein